jgi:hypothetical protein
MVVSYRTGTEKNADLPTVVSNAAPSPPARYDDIFPPFFVNKFCRFSPLLCLLFESVSAVPLGESQADYVTAHTPFLRWGF